MSQPISDVKNYYDNHVASKLQGFVEENIRVERAWSTIEKWAPKNPQRILEIGCGIGDLSWRMSNNWPEAEAIGLDVSSKSLEIAKKLFSSQKLSFIEGPLVKGLISGQFDLIVLVDVYEHISVADRFSLHEALQEVLSDTAVIFLSFPTQRRQEWLRHDLPDELQPVDEDVDIDAIVTLARETGSQVLLYEEVSIWHEADYAHSILRRRDNLLPAFQNSEKSKIGKRIFDKLFPSQLRSKRLAFVQERLGKEALLD